MLQVIVNSIVYASEIAVIAVGVSLCYSILRFADFAHIQLAIVGASLSYTFATLPGLTLSLPLAVLLSSLAPALLAAVCAVLGVSRMRRV